MKPYDSALVKAFATALRSSFASLRATCDEQFYYYAFVFDEGLRPYPSAWSYEALERSVVEHKITSEERVWWKWDYSDSPYAVYGYDAFFGEADTLLDKRAEGCSIDELYDTEWEIRIASMEEAMRILDRENFFASPAERSRVVINVECAPPDGFESERAQRLNPMCPLLLEYLNCCE